MQILCAYYTFNCTRNVFLEKGINIIVKNRDWESFSMSLYDLQFSIETWISVSKDNADDDDGDDNDDDNRRRRTTTTRKII